MSEPSADDYTAIAMNIPPQTLEEIGRLVSVGPDWAGTLARLLHRYPPEGEAFGEEAVLAWAAGVEPVPAWAVAPMGRLMGIRAGLLRQQAERCDRIGRHLRGEPQRSGM